MYECNRPQNAGRNGRKNQFIHDCLLTTKSRRLYRPKLREDVAGNEFDDLKDLRDKVAKLNHLKWMPLSKVLQHIAT